MSIDVQRGGRLAVAQEARHSCHVSAAGDQEAGVGVPQGVDVQCGRQAVLLQDQLEPPGEGGGRHGEPVPMAAEDVVRVLQLSIIIGLCLPGTFPLELFQQGFHLQREVDVPVSGHSLRFLDDDVLAGDLHHIPLDVDAAFLPVDVAPLQAAALAPPHPGGDDELEVGLILEALLLQSSAVMSRWVVASSAITFSFFFPA